jgi:hypothetical protein
MNFFWYYFLVVILSSPAWGYLYVVHRESVSNNGEFSAVQRLGEDTFIIGGMVNPRVSIPREFIGIADEKLQLIKSWD